MALRLFLLPLNKHNLAAFHFHRSKEGGDDGFSRILLKASPSAPKLDKEKKHCQPAQRDRAAGPLKKRRTEMSTSPTDKELTMDRSMNGNDVV